MNKFLDSKLNDNLNNNRTQQCKIYTKHYLQKRIFRFLFGENIYNKIKLFKVIFEYIVRRKYDFSNLLPKLINKGDIVIDIGANIGQYTCRFSRIVGSNGKVYSFEPVKSNFNSLLQMRKILNLKNTEIFNIAISDKIGTDTILIPLINKTLVISTQAALGSIHNQKPSNLDFIVEEVSTDTIDNFVEHNSILRIDYIKCDTEGGELKVLKGGENTIKKWLPILQLEINPNNNALQNLYELGYKPFYVKKSKFYKIDKNTGNIESAQFHFPVIIK